MLRRLAGPDSGATAIRWRRAGCTLVTHDFGGSGQPVLLLHGLAGYAGEWSGTAAWLTGCARVAALDARGHGASERAPSDVTRAAHLEDAVDAIDRIGAGPVVVAGQSLGGITALLLAAQHPQLVRGLVLIEASPVGADDREEAVRAGDGIARALQEWPVPFPSREAAAAFFTDRFGSSLAGPVWAAGLEERDGQLWPRFDIDVMRETLVQSAFTSYWHEWAQIRCPILLVRAVPGDISDEVVAAMRDRQPRMAVVDVPAVGHDIHLVAPTAWRSALTTFLAQLTPGS